MAEPDDFERWLREISPESFESAATIDGPWRRWLEKVYDSSGSVSRAAVLEQARADLQTLLTSGSSWTRISDDLRATTGRELMLRHRPRDDVTFAWMEVEVVLDGALIGGFGHGYSPDPETFVAELADYLREFALDEEVWGGWPICPDHGTHPLNAGLVKGTASWRCPSGRVVARIGSLVTSV